MVLTIIAICTLVKFNNETIVHFMMRTFAFIMYYYCIGNAINLPSLLLDTKAEVGIFPIHEKSFIKISNAL